MNELTISLDPHRKTPLYEQIYGFIREEIRGGSVQGSGCRRRGRFRAICR